MPKKSPNIPIKPGVIKWLRESAGWTIEDVSNYLNISVNCITEWENGDTSPTYNAVNKLAKAYKRPIAAFFLPYPEKEPSLPQDFRRLPGKSHEFSKKTIRAFRKARNLLSISKELMENLDISIDSDTFSANLDDDPEEIAYSERNAFGITVNVQNTWKSPYFAFKVWRNLIEQKNIRIFQFPMELEELRGFTIVDMKPYAIVINSSDNIGARIFTLFHEYGHILLHEPALCTPDDPITIDKHGAEVEKWCNHFAAAFLLPNEDISKDYTKYGLTHYSRISNKYKVSLSTTLTRLVSLKLISERQYLEEIGKLKKKEMEKNEKSCGSGETSAERAQREMGDAFVTLVLENSYKGHITYSKALDYLDIKTNHLKELIKRAP